MATNNGNTSTSSSIAEPQPGSLRNSERHLIQLRQLGLEVTTRSTLNQARMLFLLGQYDDAFTKILDAEQYAATLQNRELVGKCARWKNQFNTARDTQFRRASMISNQSDISSFMTHRYSVSTLSPMSRIDMSVIPLFADRRQNLDGGMTPGCEDSRPDSVATNGTSSTLFNSLLNQVSGQDDFSEIRETVSEADADKDDLVDRINEILRTAADPRRVMALIASAKAEYDRRP